MEAPGGQRVFFHHAEHLLYTNATAGGQGHGEDRIAVVVKHDRLSFHGFVLFEVCERNDAVAFLQGGYQALGGFSFIEPGGAFIADEAQGVGQVFLYQGIAGFPGRVFGEGGGIGIEEAEIFGGGVEIARFPFCDGEAFFRQFNGGSDEGCKGQFAITVGGKEPRYGARYAAGHAAVEAEGGHGVAGAVEVHIAEGLVGCGFAVVDADVCGRGSPGGAAIFCGAGYV